MSQDRSQEEREKTEDHAKKEKTVIILGASPNRARFSNKAVRAYREAGYQVIPVHPAGTEIEGIPSCTSLDEVPGSAPLLLLYVRPEIGLSSLEQAAKKGIRRVFVNPGTGSPALIRRILDLGMEPVEGCAIIALGKSPSQYPD